ncbi:MAG: Na+:solute symporter [Deltaproteobacteria bacterium]|nr:Na+:solute symporter [Deltaproteobacteria bacterium]
MQLAWIDWAIILGYLLFTVGTGFALRKLASKDMTSYFVGNRAFPWWLIGISMVATTFAADTPLAVTGIVAKDGISGNWFWWSLALSHLMVVFVLARLWRRTNVITDAEFIELRYDGKSATALRAFKAFFFALVTNCITMGWVIRAMGKIVHSFVRWEELSPGLYAWMAGWWPSKSAISDPGEGLSILIMAFVALFYASMGGLASVVVTDLVQFLLAMGGAIAFAWYAVDYVGGLDSLLERLHVIYPTRVDGILGFFPQGMTAAAAGAFVTYLTVQWWATHNSDGGGYFAQRLVAARDEHHAYRGTLLFALCHYLLRTWPWILVGLVALVVYPLVPAPGAEISSEYARVLGDREAAYPVLIAKLLPPGLMGLLAASLIAAFMSTIDTHINWGSSYLVNDVYARFLRPKASDKELVLAGRLATVLVLVVALAVTTQIDSVKGAWEFFTALGAGLGLPHLLRWVWWRVSAASELAGLVSAALVTALLYLVAPELLYFQKLLITVGVSAAAMLVATFLFQPVAPAHLQQFYRRVRPFGFWGQVITEGTAVNWRAGGGLKKALAQWAAAAVTMLVSMFALHQVFVGTRWLGVLLGVVAAAGWWLLARVADRGARCEQ